MTFYVTKKELTLGQTMAEHCFAVIYMCPETFGFPEFIIKYQIPSNNFQTPQFLLTQQSNLWILCTKPLTLLIAK